MEAKCMTDRDRCEAEPPPSSLLPWTQRGLPRAATICLAFLGLCMVACAGGELAIDDAGSADGGSHDAHSLRAEVPLRFLVGSKDDVPSTIRLLIEAGELRQLLSGQEGVLASQEVQIEQCDRNGCPGIPLSVDITDVDGSLAVRVRQVPEAIDILETMGVVLSTQETQELLVSKPESVLVRPIELLSQRGLARLAVATRSSQEPYLPDELVANGLVVGRVINREFAPVSDTDLKTPEAFDLFIPTSTLTGLLSATSTTGVFFVASRESGPDELVVTATKEDEVVGVTAFRRPNAAFSASIQLDR
jgi:hypothetical protein